MADPAQFSDSQFGFSKFCNMKIQVTSGDEKTVTVTVKDTYPILMASGEPDDIILMQAAFNAIVSQHEEDQTPGEICQ